MPAPHVVLESCHIQSIADQFDLGDVTARQQTRKVYRLDAQRGTFALQFFDAGVTRVHMQATQIARLALVQAGLAVAAPVRTSAGTTILEWDGSLCELQPWIFHDGDGHNWANLITAASALRRMHDCMVTCPAVPDEQDDPWSSPAELANQLAENVVSLRRYADHAGMVIDRFLQQAGHILETLHGAGILDSCPRQLTHGDFQGHNILFKAGALAGIIDFERLEHRPRLYDLAWPFIFWRYFGTTLGDYNDSDWQSARACCEAYAAASTPALDDHDWATLPLLMAYIPARGIAQAAREPEPVDEVVAFAKALDFATWLVEHPHDALTRLRG
jgi:Ser/Thr protein kinase RdoA (MazF antagonist)